MGTTLRCTDLKKTYDKNASFALGDADDGVSFEVEEGELFALLGPSGCGKTTTLRIIGGFLEPTAGAVEINGQDVTRKPPYTRPTNTVFQSYALFPHMDVASNVAFGLKMERIGRGSRDARVQEALRLVGLSGFGKRKVSELSGGQQQRAALARAIVKKPAVLLLDEPLGALDLKLRRQMQEEIVHLKRSTGTTFVHVTHDQEEACAIADRIAVMNEGKIVQVDTPVALYRSPRSTYIAEFINAGTIIRGEVEPGEGYVDVVHEDLVVRGAVNGTAGHDRLAALIPHDRVRLAPPGQADPSTNVASGVVDRAVFTGSVFDVYVKVGRSLEVRAAVPGDALGEIGAERLTAGSNVDVAWKAADVVVLEDA